MRALSRARRTDEKLDYVAGGGATFVLASCSLSAKQGRTMLACAFASLPRSQGDKRLEPKRRLCASLLGLKTILDFASKRRRVSRAALLQLSFRIRLNSELPLLEIKFI